MLCVASSSDITRGILFSTEMDVPAIANDVSTRICEKRRESMKSQAFYVLVMPMAADASNSDFTEMTLLSLSYNTSLRSPSFVM